MVDIPLDEMFEDAFYGVGYQGGKGPFAVYDIDKCLEVLQARGIPEFKAVRMLSHNAIAKWDGNPIAPLYIQSMSIKHIEAFKKVAGWAGLIAGD